MSQWKATVVFDRPDNITFSTLAEDLEDSGYRVVALEEVA